MCRLSMNGGIAVKTSNGYKTYNVKTGRLTNCNNFVFDIGEDMFFVIPTVRVKVGDIILVSGKPKCVIDSNDKTITVINYEDSTVENMLPERHVFMGNTYYYGKIVSMFGDNFSKGKGGIEKVMSCMMLSEMVKGSTNPAMNNMNPMLMYMMMNNNGFSDMFDGVFDFEDENDDISEEEE